MHRQPAHLVAAIVTCTAVLVTSGGVAPAAAGSLGGKLYRDPQGQAVRWVASHPGDSRAARIRSRIASRPTARWFSDPDPDRIRGSVADYVSAATRSGRLPVLVAYAIPHRDCNGASSGGAPSYAAYKVWIARFAKGLGTRRGVVILEPDSLVQAHDCSSAEVSARTSAIRSASARIRRANPRARVYLDAGHSNWRSPADTATLLRASGVTAAAGFFTNVANFRTTKAERVFGLRVIRALGGPRGVRQVIDVSRNGAGPQGSQWCDPSGRRIGRRPTLRTGRARVDAYLWIKPPGEADGCVAAAGTFVPSVAFALAR